MPETPTPFVNGHVVSSPELHASMSMLSFAPAARTAGWFASIATDGSFCLFSENGDTGLPVLTRFEVPAAPTSDVIVMSNANVSGTTRILRM